MIKFLNISCKQANAICNKAQYGEATFLEKIQLNYHILICKICALYTKQNQQLTKICKNKVVTCNKEKSTLSVEEKELLKEQLKKIK